jgi:hypothetical protein
MGHASSPGHRCLFDDERELARQIHGHKRGPFRAVPLVATDFGECFL